MRKFLLGLLVLASFAAKAQAYHNEWIDYSKTYYKFRVGTTGACRISGSVLSAAGLASAQAQQFQLWRNGVQIPIYTSVANGSFAASDYIEFWGQMNDGKTDKELYRDPSYQLNDKWSLLTDSATYFLTLNPAGPNLRLQDVPNNVAGNTMAPEPYFIYTAGQYYRDKINTGYFATVGDDHLFSSSYDDGEGWSSGDIERSSSLSATLSNLYPANTGPAPQFNIAVSGNMYNLRRYKATLNGDSVAGNDVSLVNHSVDLSTFNLNSLASGSAAVTVYNITDACTGPSCPVDRMVVHKFEVTYPRQFNFNGQPRFEFNLPANSNGNYLEINNFQLNGAVVLYDLTNNKRYLPQLSGTTLQIKLQPSATDRTLVLISTNPGYVESVVALQGRSFVNYGLAANQSNYIIISNPLLFAGAGGANPVEDYRAYRASAAGGSYAAKIYLEDQLVDQFGWGIKKNPAGIRNFLRYAQATYTAPVKQVFLLGRGVHYINQRGFESGSAVQKETLERLNLIPTFGWPASDMMLVADLATSTPLLPIGRLSAIYPDEVSIYLKKIKEAELQQQTLSPIVDDKLWMKNISHVVGGGDDITSGILTLAMENYTRTVQDTLWGAKVATFTKSTTNAIQTVADADFKNLMNQGTSLITYYGHSSPTSLEFGIEDPTAYSNQGKYPMFLALGCNAGNTYDYSDGRLTSKNLLSDRYVLAPDRGMINFVASSHFGIVHYLDIWNSRAYANFTGPLYQKTIGEIMKKTINDVYGFTGTDDFYARCNAEETVLNGDPAVRLNQQTKPDYAINESMVKIAPAFISVADQNFSVAYRIVNLGKAINGQLVVETKRQYPDGTNVVVHRDTITATRYMDSSIKFNLPVDPIHDKGQNRISVTIDPENKYDELFKSNNTISKEFFIIEDDARTVYPENFGIVSQQNIKLKASTANPFVTGKAYRMEIDTTELFNSPLKVTVNQTSLGGLLEFAPGLTFTDSTVYYWRVAPVPATGTPNWSKSSFIYLPAYTTSGYNQSHYFQQTYSTGRQLILSPTSRRWAFDSIVNTIGVRNGVFISATGQESDLSVAVNGVKYMRNACAGNTIVFNLIDPVTVKALTNPNQAYGSAPICASSRQWNFAYDFRTITGRNAARDFMDQIPAGWYVVVRNILVNGQISNYSAATWQADDTPNGGTGNTLYQRLKNAGFSSLDQLSFPRVFSFIYQKGTSYAPSAVFTDGIFDVLTHTANAKSPDSVGQIFSPAFGPAKAWKQLIWRGSSLEANSADKATVNIIGIKQDGSADTLVRDLGLNQQNYAINNINAATYPYLKLGLSTQDSVTFTPYQLRYWRLTYDPIPEGALAPALVLKMKDTLEVGEPLDFAIGFKNISDVSFADTLRVKLIVTDRNNVQHVYPAPRLRKLDVGAADTVRWTIDTKNLVGINTLFVEVNPAGEQPEQLHFNNLGYKSFVVKGDTLNPLLDVTFDNVHILNRDVVSAKPDVVIKLKDEAKWLLLNDPSLANVQVRFPDGSLKTYAFGTDTLTFTPATGAPNASNTATIRLKPYFAQDGDYELIVSAKDRSDNTAGSSSYHIGFQVINKAMISNMLNYPNPFTTSTAFVFTLTGSEVPQNIKIQVLTVTGKIVREITKAELGPLHIGRNITEFKWDGTDQFGQKVANGVYLYHVVTNLNGKGLEKYKADGDTTDKYFNKGYGKMVLIR